MGLGIQTPDTFGYEERNKWKVITGWAGHGLKRLYRTLTVDSTCKGAESQALGMTESTDSGC